MDQYQRNSAYLSSYNPEGGAVSAYLCRGGEKGINPWVVIHIYLSPPTDILNIVLVMCTGVHRYLVGSPWYSYHVYGPYWPGDLHSCLKGFLFLFRMPDAFMEIVCGKI